MQNLAESSIILEQLLAYKIRPLKGKEGAIESTSRKLGQGAESS